MVTLFKIESLPSETNCSCAGLNPPSLSGDPFQGRVTTKLEAKVIFVYIFFVLCKDQFYSIQDELHYTWSHWLKRKLCCAKTNSIQYKTSYIRVTDWKENYLFLLPKARLLQYLLLCNPSRAASSPSGQPLAQSLSSLGLVVPLLSSHAYKFHNFTP